MELNIVWYLLIFFSRVIDVSLGTIRTLLIVRGKRKSAALAGFFEVIIYIIALKTVVQNIDNITSILFYACGFATGNIVGGWIEEKMAIGHFTLQVITKVEPMELARALRKEGFGVTVIEGTGKEGPRYISNVMLKRKDYQRLMNFIEKWDKYAFITVSDARRTKGGFLEIQKK